MYKINKILFVGPELSTSMSLSTMFQKSRAWSISWRILSAWSWRLSLSCLHRSQRPADCCVTRHAGSAWHRMVPSWRFCPLVAVSWIIAHLHASKILSKSSLCLDLPQATGKAGMTSGRGFLLFLVHDLRSGESIRVLRNVKCWQLREINVSYIWARVFRQRLAARCATTANSTISTSKHRLKIQKPENKNRENWI